MLASAHVRRHTEVTCSTGVKPPKPGANRYDHPNITSPPPTLCEAMRPVSDENASVRGRSGPDKGLPYLHVNGPSGPLYVRIDAGLGNEINVHQEHFFTDAGK